MDLKQALTFFDQKLTSDGKPYAPLRLKQIVKENFFLTKHLHTSYGDLLEMSPTERKYLLEFLVEDFKKQKEAREAAAAAREDSRRK